MRKLLHAVSAFMTLALVSGPAPAQTSGKIIVEEFMVAAKDAGIQIYVRTKHPEGMSQFSADRTVVFVHGATYPAETAFDLQLGGQSWMDYIASRGFDVYLLDVRGYGRSTRPKEMDQPAGANAPISDTATARADVGTVVDHVLQRRGIQTTIAMSCSWPWSVSVDQSRATASPNTA